MNIHVAGRLPLTKASGARAARRPAVLALRGFVCDRYTTAGMEGASLLAGAAAARLGAPLREMGNPGPARDLGWRASLAEAAPYLRGVARQTEALMQHDRLPLIFANRCGASLATIPAMLRQWPEAKLLWLDAHGDFHAPETTQTGYLGGMVLPALCGLWDSGLGAGLSPGRIVLAGTRDLDPGEGEIIAAHEVRMVTAQDGKIDAERIMEAIGGAPVLIHIDTDVIDPLYLPAEYQVPDGLRPSAVHALLRGIVRGSEIVGLEVTEFEAPTGPDGRARAVRTAMRMIAPVLRAGMGLRGVDPI